MTTISNINVVNISDYKKDGAVAYTGDKAEEYLGQKGCVVVADTNAHTPGSGKCFFAIQMLADTVLNTLTPATDSPITGTITGITLGTNIFIYGKFTNLKLTSGSCIAYLGVL